MLNKIVAPMIAFVATAVVITFSNMSCDPESPAFSVRRIFGEPAIAGIEMAPQNSSPFQPGYYRQWITGPDGCTSGRRIALDATSQIPARFDSAHCSIVWGMWQDESTGEIFQDAAQVTVDRLVPLHELHRSGGFLWPPAKRLLFANTAEDPDLTYIVSRDVAEARKDLDPTGWMPERSEKACEYLSRWVRVKRHWGLTMDEAETAFVRTHLLECDGGKALVKASPIIGYEDLLNSISIRFLRLWKEIGSDQPETGPESAPDENGPDATVARQD